MGVVEGGDDPVPALGAEKKRENFENRLSLDPEAKCYLPGVPRATYMPHPFQIVQTPTTIMFAYQYAGAVRTIYMEDPGPAPADSWMGWSVGRWEGDTLVVDVDELQRSDLVRPGRELPQRGAARRRALHADRPRPSPVRSDHRRSESVHAAVEDQHAALSARGKECSQFMEFKCVEFAEELMYGHLRKQHGDSSQWRFG